MNDSNTLNIPANPMFVELIRYNNWANRQLLDTCLHLGDDLLAATSLGTFGTIRDTLAHIIRSESGYLRMLTGTRPQPAFNWEHNPSLTDISLYADQVGAALLEAVLQNKPTDSVTITWEEQNHTGLYQAVAVWIQLINHGIEHRTNVTTILSQAEVPTPKVDGWGYWETHMEQLVAPSNAAL